MGKVLIHEGKRQPPKGKMTYEEFLAWVDEDTYAEWVNGEVIIVSPASLRHQDIARFLGETISAFARLHDLGVVISAPFQMKLPDSGREPDILFIAKAHLDRLHETYLDGPADLVVEIVSPESATRDRGEKFYEYEAAGIPEYWLIDPQREVAECHQLQGKVYRPAFSGHQGTYHSRVLPGFWINVEWLWQDPLPRAEDVLLQVAGEAYLRHIVRRVAAHHRLQDLRKLLQEEE